jgi:hypothetical protein
MQVYIVLSPTLNVTAHEFIDAWNAAPQSQTMAQATPGVTKAFGYPLDPQLSVVGTAATLKCDTEKRRQFSD